jgi:hypothetical protein
MTTTTETQVAALANNLVDLTSRLYAISQEISQASALWTNIGAASLLNAFPSFTASATGGYGSTDGSPNVAHPINIGVQPGSLLSRAISANDLASLLTFLQGIQTAIGGGAVSANGAAVQLVAKTL